MEPEIEAAELDFSGNAPDLSKVPRQVKWIAFARSVRWFGWGFGETLLPVFILSFSSSLTETGLINSVLDLVFLLSVPVVGFLADTMSSRTLLIIGLLLYPFIGLSYYLAGATGILLFVIIARVINGVGYCFDTVGMDTYIRRFTPRKGIASAFGYTASLANLSWLGAALIGAYLVRFVSISDLLFLVTPFSLLALIPLMRAERDKAPKPSRMDMRLLFNPFASFLKEFAAMQKGLRHVVFLMFILDFALVAASFFIPIAAYKAGASLSAVAILCVLAAAPSLTEFWLAEFIDGSKVKRKWSLFVSLAVLPVLFFAASFLTAFSERIVIAFGIELAAIFGSLALQSYATVLSRRERFGETSSALEGASTLGDLTAPLFIGLLTDAVGFPIMFGLVASMFIFIAVYFYRNPVER